MNSRKPLALNLQEMAGRNPKNLPKIRMRTLGRRKKNKGRGKRGAPKGHRGATRPVPDQVDREEVFAPPQVCECGCERISPLDDFDVRYIEDIPPAMYIFVKHQLDSKSRNRCQVSRSLLFDLVRKKRTDQFTETPGTDQTPARIIHPRG